MDWYLVSVLIFIVILAALVYRDRKKFKRESFLLLRRTQRGKEIIINIGTRFPRGWKWVGYVSVAVGFIVSVLGLKMLIDNFVKAITVKATTPSLALLLPSPTAQPIFGYGFLAVPFWYWIICLALLALVHEGMHGVFAAREKVRIKSMGIGILAVIPLAFVEPDEKQLEKKGMWPMLRVFSAGSFGNFLLAGLTLLVVMLITASIFYPSGVIFGAGQYPYPAQQIGLSAVQKTGNTSVSGPDDIKNALAASGENETVEIKTGNGTFFLKKGLLLQQLNKSQSSLIVFEDYPAARAGLEGTIIRINDYEIRDTLDLSLALEMYGGPGKTISVVTMYGKEERTFLLTTVQRPENPPYQPDGWIMIFAAMEHVVPGSIESSYSMLEAFSGLFGQRTGVTWTYAKDNAAMWAWVSENYPLLRERAQAQIDYWNGQMQSHPKPGFIGIIGITQDYKLKPGLEPFKDFLDFFEGLLFFLFIINIGVAIVNLLPLKPLDGGRMWDAVLKRYLPKKQAERIIRCVGYFTLLMLLLNFIPFGALF